MSDDILLESHVIDIRPYTALNTTLWPTPFKFVFIRIPGLCLDLNQVNYMAVSLKDVHPHEQVAELECRLGDVHMMLLHQFLGACQRAFIVFLLDIVFQRHLAIDFGEFSHLEATLGQRLQELVLHIRIGINIGIAVVI